MLGRMWEFVRRHKKKFIFSTVFFGGGFVLWQYAKTKLRHWQEKEAQEMLVIARKQHHFDSNQRTCNMTTLSFLNTLRASMTKWLNSDDLLAQIRDHPENKVALWDELKIVAFTRLCVAIYSSNLLVIFLRVQLNVLGAYLFVETMRNEQSKEFEEIHTSFEVQKKYMETVQYLFREGMELMVEDVKSAVITVMGTKSLKERLNLNDLIEMINQIRNITEKRSQNGRLHSDLSDFPRYLLESDGFEDDARSFTRDELLLKTLADDTKDVAESEQFSTLLRTCFDTSFSRIFDKLAEHLKSSNSDELNLRAIHLPLAKIVPVTSGMLMHICGDPPNAFIQELLSSEKVQDFSANIYEAFIQQSDQPPK